MEVAGFTISLPQVQSAAAGFFITLFVLLLLSRSSGTSAPAVAVAPAPRAPKVDDMPLSPQAAKKIGRLAKQLDTAMTEKTVSPSANRRRRSIAPSPAK